MNDHESAVLSGIMIDSDVVDVHVIGPELFFDSCARAIFVAIQSVRAKGVVVDLISVADSLRAAGHADLIVGLANVTSSIFSTGNFAYYVGELREAKRRDAASLAFRTGLEGLADKSRAATEIVDEAERSLTAAIRGAPEADDATIGGLLPKYLHALGDKAKALREGRSEEIEIGLTRLDGVLGGVRPGEVVVIAARPNVGKTVLALSIAAHAALDLNRPSAFFSLEMKRDDVIERLISARSSFTLAQLRGGQVTAKDLPALEVVAGRIAKAPLSIYDGDHGLPLLTSRIRRECTLRSLRLAAIDYLGLVDVRGSKAARWEVIGEVSRSLKILAIELNIVILVCVQINRDGDGKEPVLANLRDSGAIEQDADRVILLHGLDKGEGQSFRRVVAIVAKNRHGARGRVELLLEGSHVRFVEG